MNRNENIDCSICQEDAPTRKQIRLSCSHPYHISCLRKYLRYERQSDTERGINCPQCRRPVPDDTVEMLWNETRCATYECVLPPEISQNKNLKLRVAIRRRREGQEHYLEHVTEPISVGNLPTCHQDHPGQSFIAIDFEVTTSDPDARFEVWVLDAVTEMPLIPETILTSRSLDDPDEDNDNHIPSRRSPPPPTAFLLDDDDDDSEVDLLTTTTTPPVATPLPSSTSRRTGDGNERSLVENIRDPPSSFNSPQASTSRTGKSYVIDSDDDDSRRPREIFHLPTPSPPPPTASSPQPSTSSMPPPQRKSKSRKTPNPLIMERNRHQRKIVSYEKRLKKLNIISKRIERHQEGIRKAQLEFQQVLKLAESDFKKLFSHSLTNVNSK